MTCLLSGCRPDPSGSSLELFFTNGSRSSIPLKLLRDGQDLLLDDAYPPACGIGKAEISASGGSLTMEHRDGLCQSLTAVRAADLAGLLDPGLDLPVDLVVTNASWMITCAGKPDDPSIPAMRRAEEILDLIPGGCLACRAGRVVDTGPEAEVLRRIELAPEAMHVDAGKGGICPGFIDAHTHPIFAGQRSSEFAMRAAGADYLAIARAGGGIRSTVAATRKATDEELRALTMSRLGRMTRWGTTSIEGKSGYELTVPGELRLLRILTELDPIQPVDIQRTLLAAHVIPPEHKDDRETYIRRIIEEIIPQAARQGLARACDVFCEEGAYTLDESRRILEAARAAGLGVRIHADQFHDLGAVVMATELDALSADHLEASTDSSVEALARSSTVAVLLPGAALTVGGRFPDARRLLDRNVPVALATDCNPGTSMTESLPLMISLACTRMGMTVPEALLAVTVQAARAMGRKDTGKLARGMAADFVIHDAPEPAYIPYHLGSSTVKKVFKLGGPAYEAP